MLREHGTERACTSPLDHEKRPGRFVCAGCGEPLFKSDNKFESGSGWPSFDRPVAEQSVATETDMSAGMVRTEVTCAKCGGHLGHVFDDGPRETTGARFCINSLSLDFMPDDQSDQAGE